MHKFDTRSNLYSVEHRMSSHVSVKGRQTLIDSHRTSSPKLNSYPRMKKTALNLLKLQFSWRVAGGYWANINSVDHQTANRKLMFFCEHARHPPACTARTRCRNWKQKKPDSNLNIFQPDVVWSSFKFQRRSFVSSILEIFTSLILCRARESSPFSGMLVLALFKGRFSMNADRL